MKTPTKQTQNYSFELFIQDLNKACEQPQPVAISKAKEIFAYRDRVNKRRDDYGLVSLSQVFSSVEQRVRY